MQFTGSNGCQLQATETGMYRKERVSCHDNPLPLMKRKEKPKQLSLIAIEYDGKKSHLPCFFLFICLFHFLVVLEEIRREREKKKHD